MEHGVTEMKFFPAASTGGPQALRALAGPLPEVIFCPTGGIDRATSSRLPRAAERGLCGRILADAN